jgi:D-sedoheptulose 7-phosphate isomerase
METLDKLRDYARSLSECFLHAAATDRDGHSLSLESVVGWTIETARGAHAAGNKLVFIGNGGSASIASHMAIDYAKNGLRSLAFNDAPALTCLGNDFGYEQVFVKQIEFHGREGDLLVAISSSGASENILNGVAAARTAGLRILTLSGFRPDNPLRRLGDRNLYVSSAEYGFVELTHLALCHAILDVACGWTPQSIAAAGS